MSVKSQVQAAEEALRQALINALAEGDEQYLSELFTQYQACLLYTSPSPRDRQKSRMPSSA